MVVYILPHENSEWNDHREDALHFELPVFSVRKLGCPDPTKIYRKLGKFDFYRNQYIFVVQGPPNFLNCDLLTPNQENTESLLVMESLPIKTKIAGIIGPPHIFRSKQSCILVNPGTIFRVMVHGRYKLNSGRSEQ